MATAVGPQGTKAYRYDDRSRLVRVQDTGSEGCTTRVYSFVGDSNRSSLTSYGPDGDGACQATSGGSVTDYGFDQADRITGGYEYDLLGRTTTLPKRDTNLAGVAGASDAVIN